MNLLWHAQEWCIFNRWAGAIEINRNVVIEVLDYCRENLNQHGYRYDYVEYDYGILKIRKKEDLVFITLKWG